MSIYSTLWEIKVPRHHCFDEEWVQVYAQAVPAHIGHPSCYPEGDPYASFLPPVVQNYDPETGEAPYDRAVVIVQEGRDAKHIQEYIDPLIIISGEEYARTPFAALLHRIHKAIGWDDSVFGMYFSPSGEKKILRADEPDDSDA
jgi:hypothetical protein